MKMEPYLKSLCWICPKPKDDFVNKAKREILALNSMIASLNPESEKEESNCDLHLKLVGFQCIKYLKSC